MGRERKPGRCLVLKGEGIKQKLPWRKGYRAPQELSEAWKFWHVLISRDLRQASGHKAQKEFDLENVSAAEDLRGHQPSLTLSQMRKSIFRKVPYQGH